MIMEVFSLQTGAQRDQSTPTQAKSLGSIVLSPGICSFAVLRVILERHFHQRIEIRLNSAPLAESMIVRVTCTQERMQLLTVAFPDRTQDEHSVILLQTSVAGMIEGKLVRDVQTLQVRNDIVSNSMRSRTEHLEQSVHSEFALSHRDDRGIIAAVSDSIHQQAVQHFADGMAKAAEVAMVAPLLQLQAQASTLAQLEYNIPAAVMTTLPAAMLCTIGTTATRVCVLFSLHMPHIGTQLNIDRFGIPGAVCVTVFDTNASPQTNFDQWEHCVQTCLLTMPTADPDTVLVTYGDSMCITTAQSFERMVYDAQRAALVLMIADGAAPAYVIAVDGVVMNKQGSVPEFIGAVQKSFSVSLTGHWVQTLTETARKRGLI
eukprot:TRINITY_DN12044_c0_g1_i1.p1 TRINITY_DN12044_c0_g1~~TRINITY_DN12044_c0_g1_i1.p1  ORF type:complete len:375 (+),score=76.86 TRINITY_DN12044_c0_g1_i1:68-1192(+)